MKIYLLTLLEGGCETKDVSETELFLYSVSFFLLFWARNPKAHLILYKNKSQCKNCKTILENRGKK